MGMSVGSDVVMVVAIAVVEFCASVADAVEYWTGTKTGRVG
jgi:hypothetical protein